MLNELLAAPEANRLRFIAARDGKKGAIEFAARTLRIYRKAVLCSRKRGYEKPHHASLPEYRRGFIESYCAFKAYLAANRRSEGAAPLYGAASLSTAGLGGMEDEQ